MKVKELIRLLKKCDASDTVQVEMSICTSSLDTSADSITLTAKINKLTMVPSNHSVRLCFDDAIGTFRTIDLDKPKTPKTGSMVPCPAAQAAIPYRRNEDLVNINKKEEE